MSMGPANHCVAAVQMVSTRDVDRNLLRAEHLIARAAEAGASLVVLPEAFACYDGGALTAIGAAEASASGPLRSFLSARARAHGIVLVGGTIPVLDERCAARPRAACFVYGPDGVELGRYDKMHLFDVQIADAHGSYRESDLYEPGTDVVAVSTPLGELGLAVCYDLRFPELFRVLFQRGIAMLALPSAFTRLTGEAHWHVLLRARAIENQVFVIAPDQGGRHSATRESYGGSVIIDPWGGVLASASTGEAVVTARLDPGLREALGCRLPVARHQRIYVPDPE